MKNKKDFKIKITVAIVFAVISTMASMFIPRLTGKVIDSLENFNSEIFIDYLLKIMLLIVIYFLFRYLMGRINAGTSTKLVAEKRKKAYKSMLTCPMEQLDKHSAGEISSIIANDADILADGLLMSFNQLFSAVVTLVMALVFMFLMDSRLAVAVVLTSPLSFLVSWFIAHFSYNMFKVQAEKRADMGGLSGDLIKNQKLIKNYNFGDKSAEDFNRKSDDLEKASRMAIFYSSLTNPSIRMVNNIIYAVVAWIGAKLILSDNLTVGTLSGFLIYVNQFTTPLNELTSIISEIQNAFVCRKRLDSLILEAEDDNKEDLPKEVKGEVQFKNIYFSYDKNKKLIEDFNLEAEPEKTIAIVGKTGCGKSTLINLLMGFYKPDKGEIYIDGKDISKYSKKSLRNILGMVLQETWIKKASIRDNMLYGNNNEKELMHIAEITGADGFIRRLPEGYDTIVDDDDEMLSEGERQLISICRVLLKEPEIVILDEATSSLDKRTQRLVQDSCLKLMEGRTAFVVAHRLETINSADRIVRVGS